MKTSILRAEHGSLVSITSAVILSLLLTFASSTTSGQGEQNNEGAKINIVEQRASNLSPQSTRILGENGKAVGSYEMVTKEDNSVKFMVHLPDGSDLEVVAKDNVLVAENANRILSIGDDVFSHVNYDADIWIYDENGQLISSEPKVVQMPYAFALSGNGELFIAGKRGETEADAHNVFIKYDKNGNQIWEKKMPMAVPSRVYVSGDNQRIAAARYNSSSRLNVISYYTSSGTLIHEDNTHGTFTSLEFLSNNKVVVVCGHQWFLYELNANYNLINQGLLTGNGIGNHPITELAGQGKFAIINVAYPESNSGFMVNVFDYNTGAPIADEVIPGQPYYTPYRVATLLPNGNINLDLGSEEFEISIENN